MRMSTFKNFRHISLFAEKVHDLTMEVKITARVEIKSKLAVFFKNRIY